MINNSRIGYLVFIHLWRQQESSKFCNLLPILTIIQFWSEVPFPVVEVTYIINLPSSLFLPQKIIFQQFHNLQERHVCVYAITFFFVKYGKKAIICKIAQILWHLAPICGCLQIKDDGNKQENLLKSAHIFLLFTNIKTEFLRKSWKNWCSNKADFELSDASISFLETLFFFDMNPVQKKTKHFCSNLYNWKTETL